RDDQRQHTNQLVRKRDGLMSPTWRQLEGRGSLRPSLDTREAPPAYWIHNRPSRHVSELPDISGGPAAKRVSDRSPAAAPASRRHRRLRRARPSRRRARREPRQANGPSWATNPLANKRYPEPSGIA